MFEYAGFDQYKYVARLEARTCKVCGKLDGQLFNVRDGITGKNMPPMHPWCRCTTAPWDEAIAQTLTDNDTRWARDPDTGQIVHVPMTMTYEEWQQKYDELHPDMPMYRQRDKIYRRNADEKMWKEYQAIAGKENMPKTLDDFQDLKYNNSKQHDWWLTKGYVAGIRDKHLSALTGIQTYKIVDEQLQEKVIGVVTSDGITIRGYKTHFIDRVIGNYNEKRDGVSIGEIVHNITTSTTHFDSVHSGKASRKYVSLKSAVVLNPETGILIQTNPL